MTGIYRRMLQIISKKNFKEWTGHLKSNELSATSTRTQGEITMRLPPETFLGDVGQIGVEVKSAWPWSSPRNQLEGKPN